MRFVRLFSPLLFLFGLTEKANSSGVDDSIKIVITADKREYAFGETLVFQVAARNIATSPISVLVRDFTWEDLARMDRAYADLRNREAQLASANKELADKIRTEGGPRPLGELQLVTDKPRRLGPKYDDVWLCGTFVRNAMMPSGAETRTTYQVDQRDLILRTCKVEGRHLRPMFDDQLSPGTYRFRWQAYRPAKSKFASAAELSVAVSNVVEINIGN